jgi:hypothetical protein
MQNEALNTVDSKVAGLFINAIVSISSSFSKVFIIIDGIDECPAGTRREFCASLLTLTRGNIKLFVTSRRERDIGEEFSEVPHLEMTEDLSSIDKAIHLDWAFQNDRELKKIKSDAAKIKQHLLSQRTET